MPTPDPIDEQIGRNIRAARQAAKLSQLDLATFLATTHQQVHRYEAGKNRMAASTLVKLCRLLPCQPAELLAGCE